VTTSPPAPPAALLTPSGPPAEAYDVALLDLDGVIYLGRQPVPGAAPALAAARDAGMRLAFVTNNASRSPEDVALLLDEVGVKADVSEVVTSAQAAARVLAERVPAGSRVLVVGAAALRDEVARRGLVPVDSADDDPDALICGYAPDVGWRQLAEGTVAVRRGIVWVATNTDLTLPSARGPLPGNGTLVNAIIAASGRQPVVAGKPNPALHQESVDRTGSKRPIVVGDRLDTDIEGAVRVGCASMLVFSGVTTPLELFAAGPMHRPTFVGHDVGGLLLDHPAVDRSGAGWQCGRWEAVADGDAVALRVGAGQRSDTDELDAIRTTCVAFWTSTAESRSVEEIQSRLRAGDADAAALLAEWGVG
jgi:glycerol 3-phosphatase-2